MDSCHRSEKSYHNVAKKMFFLWFLLVRIAILMSNNISHFWMHFRQKKWVWSARWDNISRFVEVVCSRCFLKLGVPLNHPFWWDFPWNQPSSYWGTLMQETPISLSHVAVCYCDVGINLESVLVGLCWLHLHCLLTWQIHGGIIWRLNPWLNRHV